MNSVWGCPQIIIIPPGFSAGAQEREIEKERLSSQTCYRPRRLVAFSRRRGCHRSGICARSIAYSMHHRSLGHDPCNPISAWAGAEHVSHVVSPPPTNTQLVRDRWAISKAGLSMLPTKKSGTIDNSTPSTPNSPSLFAYHSGFLEPFAHSPCHHHIARIGRQLRGPNCSGRGPISP